MVGGVCVKGNWLCWRDCPSLFICLQPDGHGSWFVRILFMEFPKCFFGCPFEESIGFPGIVSFRVFFPFDKVFGAFPLMFQI